MPLRCRLLALVAAAAMVLTSAGVRAADARWLDIESRIQYGYFTEDLRALRDLVEPLASNDSHDRLKSYYAALLAYRLTLLAQAQAGNSAGGDKLPTVGAGKGDRGRNEARQTLARCVGSLDHALEAQSDFADALALQSACLGLLAELSPWRAPLAAPKSASQIRKALQLAPQNPRVLLLDAIGAYEHAQASGAAAAGQCDKFKNTAAVFETERAGVDRIPGWGAAEAYTWLGRCYLDNGDPNTARDALERALLIAPEFAQARRLLTSITSG